MEREVICLPSEAQLRDRLGVAFGSLERDQDRYRCTVKVGEDPLAYEATDPADAYGLALLDLIEEAETYLRVLVDEL